MTAASGVLLFFFFFPGKRREWGRGEKNSLDVCVCVLSLRRCFWSAWFLDHKSDDPNLSDPFVCADDLPFWRRPLLLGFCWWLRSFEEAWIDSRRAFVSSQPRRPSWNSVPCKKQQLRVVQQSDRGPENMKFGKTYSEYIDKHARNRLSGCSNVEFKRLKKLLKKCPLQDHGSTPASVASSASVAAASSSSPCELLLSQTTSFPASSADDQTWKMTQKDGSCLDSSTVSSGCPSSCPGEDQESFLRLSILLLLPRGMLYLCIVASW